MISRTCATVSSVWEVDGLPGQGSSSKDQRPFLKWEYHSNVFDRLRQDSPKAACSISYISAPVFPRRKQIDAHTLLNFLLHHEMWRTLQIDVHLQASTERMRGDTGFRLCKYTCTDLPPVLPFCCFAAYNSFPEKKSVPELNDQPTCVFLWKLTIKGSHILAVFIYLLIYIYYSYSLKNGIPLVKESAITNLVEHPIQLRPPSKSLFSLFTMFETFLLQGY